VEQGGVVRRLLQICMLEARTGASPARTFRAEQPIVRIGSHPSNDVVLDDQTVSKHHLELHYTPAGYRLIDLSSSNGTFHGAVRIHDVTVAAAVTLQLGATTLTITPSREETAVPASARDRFGALVGGSPVMRELFARLETIAASDASVLIEGETGTGKELVAESLHLASPRSGGPFAVVDCGALPAGLAEAELFGAVRGAFTGADHDRPGLLELAHRGTLFLDEIGELPAALQVKLLGVLERRRFAPVGSTRSRELDVRLVAATHRNLAREVNEGRFRADLFYRIATVRVAVPPLRERLEDIPALVAEILADEREQHPEVPPQLSAIALARMQSRSWPGNVRELRSAVERAVRQIDAADTGPAAEHETFAAARSRGLAELERRYLLDVLERSSLNVSEAARAAGMDRRNFQRLLRRHRIDVRALRGG
jgi:transcriptional regulator with PAS, ATPase and Fis domain